MKTFVFTIEVIIEAEDEAKAIEEFRSTSVNIDLYDFEVQEIYED